MVVLVAAGCSGGGKSAASSSSTQASGSATAPTSAPVPAQPDFINGDYACSLIKQDELTQIYGRPAKALESNGGRLLAFFNSDTSNCREESEDGGLILQFTIYRGHTLEVAQSVWTNITAARVLEPLPDVGEEAVLNGDTALFARRQFETLQLSIIDVNHTAVDIKSMTIAIGKLIAARMGSGASSVSECVVGDDGLVPPGQRLSADDLAFEASQDEGKYSGTWNNDTFGTSGTVEADVAFDLNARTATVKFQFKGDTLGIQGDGLAETVVIEVDRPVAHVRSNTLGDLVITRPLGFGCPTRPVSASADQPSNSSLSGLNATLDVGSATVNATFDITYPNGKTSAGSFTLRRGGCRALPSPPCADLRRRRRAAAPPRRLRRRNRGFRWARPRARAWGWLPVLERLRRVVVRRLKGHPVDALIGRRVRPVRVARRRGAVRCA